MKVLNIGLPRTGTYSLFFALKSVGFSCIHYPKNIDDINNFSSACEVRFCYKELEKRFPGSLYIYTKRNLEEWLLSCRRHKKHYKKGWNPFWEKEDCWEEEYTKKEKSLSFFNDKKERLLIFNVFNGDGWQELGEFLKIKVPNYNFPHLNSSESYLDL